MEGCAWPSSITFFANIEVRVKFNEESKNKKPDQPTNKVVLS